MQKDHLTFYDKDEGDSIVKIGKALSSPIRTEMLRLLHGEQMTVTELSKTLGYGNSSILFHIGVLADAGLVDVQYLPSKKGSAQSISIGFESLHFDFAHKARPAKEFVLEQSIPVGLYSDAEFYTNFRFVRQCGDGYRIERLKKEDVFNPLRTSALLLWTTGGRVEYNFSNKFAKEHTVREIRFSLEICSETAYYRNDWKSDITFSVNGRELCMWTCPGDYGGTRGNLNPDWWDDTNTQFGDLVTVAVNRNGTFLNNARVGETTIADLALDKTNRLTFSLGNKRDALHMGGFNLFGKTFGNFAQDINLFAVCEDV